MEKIVSPGVFTSENDISFLPQGIGEIGAAFIGATVKGRAFEPTVIESPNEFERVFGPETERSYLPFAVKNYLKNAGKATVIRLLGEDGYTIRQPLVLALSGSYGTRAVAVLHPTVVLTNADTVNYFEATTVQPTLSVSGSSTGGDFVLTLSGSFTTDTGDDAYIAGTVDKNGTNYSASLDPTDTKFIGDLFPRLAESKEPLYNYILFDNVISASLSQDSSSFVVRQGSGSLTGWAFTSGYASGVTPWIQSQKISEVATDLFRVYHRSHGTDTNYEVKIQITNVRAAGSIPGTDYGSFSLQVRAVDQDNIWGSPYSYDDSDSRQNILEQFDNLSLDPNATNYIVRKIGDRYTQWNSTDLKLEYKGDYPNKSEYIRIDPTDALKEGALSAVLVPFGHQPLYQPISSVFSNTPSASFVTDQNIGGIYNKKKPWGVDFTNTDNLNYLKPLPDAALLTTGSNVAFYLGNFNQPAAANYPTVATAFSGAIDLTSNTSAETRKFIVPMQGGFDGFRPHVQRKMAAKITNVNTQGFDMTSGAWGDDAYRRALDIISNADEYDINMLVLPGVINELHSGVAARAIEVCEDRGDAFYPMDGFSIDTNVASAIVESNLLTTDSNYTSVWFPWVKIMNKTKNKPMWVPPSVVLPEIIAYSDKVSQPWFAPAGLNRGGITEALEAYTRLNHAERDDLYENRINPIATFPGQGIVVWGQKTLQAKASALDRINVRRLLIALKKFVASASKYLVFEQNSSSTRNQFLNIVNPYMESVQQRQGLHAFKVVCSEENNTPDLIDRNILKGDIYLQPTKTSEFIIIGFNVLPTGATFS